MLKDKVIYTYEMNPFTMAVLSKEKSNGTFSTVVLEENEEYTVFQTRTKVIEFACKFYGLSLPYSVEGTKDVCNIIYLVRIVIAPVSGIYFFHTELLQNKNCSWLDHPYIADINPIIEGTKTDIKFTNG